MKSIIGKLPGLLVKSGIAASKDVSKISVELKTSDVARRQDKKTLRFHVAVEGVPKFVVRYLPKGWDFPSEEILATIKRYSQFKSINVPKVLNHFATDDGYFIVAEFIESAASLDDLVSRGTVGAGQALQILRELFVEVYGSGRRPTKDMIESEIAHVLSCMRQLVKEGVWADIILRYVENAIRSNGEYLREVYTSGDIIDRNILFAGGRWYLIDYEYSHRTIFGFADAFRNILYAQWAKGFSLADLYPPLKNFPIDAATMISVALEYEFQSRLLEDPAREVTQKHLRYTFWNAIDPSIVSGIDRRLAAAEELLRQKEDAIEQIRAELLKWQQLSAERENQISDLSRENERRAAELLKLIDIRQLEIESLKGLQNLQKTKIEELDALAQAKSLRVAELTNWSDDLQHQIRVQGDKLKIQQFKIDEMAAQLQGTIADYIYIKSTLSYSLGRILTLPFVIIFKLLVWLYKGIDAVLGRFLWPIGSKRAVVMNALEHFPETIATGTYLLRVHGVKGLFKGVRDTWSAGANLGLLRNQPPSTVNSVIQNTLPKRRQPNAIKPLERPESAVVPDTGISVVIPALNEQDNLALLLPSLLSQKGFTAIDIIVVDSGSTDGSVAVAKEYGATVIEILPKDFSHSGSRNLGAEHAKQRYMLSMTADALPSSDTWLYEMYRFLKTEGLAAVSCMEVPRADVDLFSRVQMWNHYANFLELTGVDKVLTLPSSRDPSTLRKHAQLTDVACLVNKDIFDKYRYRHEYGEDLDLGLRLIGDGLKIGLMSSIKVIHSHRRSPYYHLKRAYVDELIIGRILNEPPPVGLNLNDILSEILGTWQLLDQLSVSNVMQGEETITVVDLKKRMRAGLVAEHRRPALPIQINKDHPFVDGQFAEFLRKLPSLIGKSPSRPKASGQIIAGLNDFLVLAFEYMEETYDRVDELIAKDAVDLLFKQYAVLCGAYIASCTAGPLNGENAALKYLSEELGGRDIKFEEASIGKVEAR